MYDYSQYERQARELQHAYFVSLIEKASAKIRSAFASLANLVTHRGGQPVA